MRVLQGWTPLHSSNVGGYEYHVNGWFAASVVLESIPRPQNKDRPVVAVLSSSRHIGRFTTIEEAKAWVEARVIENELMKGASR